MVMIKTCRMLLNNIFFTVLLAILCDCGQAVSNDQNVLFCRPFGHTLRLWTFTKYIKSSLFIGAFLLWHSRRAKLWAHLMVYSPRKANTSHLLWTNCQALMLCATSKSYLVQLLHAIFIIQHWIMWTDVKFVECFISKDSQFHKNSTYALWGNNSGSISLRESSASCEGLCIVQWSTHFH